VYQLATRHKLTGWVRNTSGEVEIELAGLGSSIETFIQALQKEAPPLARIESMVVERHSSGSYNSFQIRESQPQEGSHQLVSPDIATCETCLKEVFDPKDRRYRYPFTNCTNCGPRFTIIQDIPYDRPRTTMCAFEMCPDCLREYNDPSDRRFHAQPNACPVCGPRVDLLDACGVRIECDDAITKAAALLKQGHIVAVKGLGGFLLACDATDVTAVQRLRQRKHRPSKPFAIMVATLKEAQQHCDMSDAEASLLASPHVPIVLARWKRADSTIVGDIAPGLAHIGMMLPYTPLHHILMRAVDHPLVMTSGNLSEEPIAKDNDEALRRLKGIADFFLVHNRDIYSRYDDSVFVIEGNIPRPVRRARGYAPYPVHLAFQTQQVLACGAELKNTFCLTRDNHAFISQHIGDMENLETLRHFEDTLSLYKRLFRINPRIVAYDPHPEYLATKHALSLATDDPSLTLIPVQHHHAHIASCLAEHGVTGPVIGVAMDGLGYGSDGMLWGGEFLIADLSSFHRAGHFESVPMPGGAAAILKPWRMAIGYIHTLLDKPLWRELAAFRAVERNEGAVVLQQLERKLNAPLTSSCGRLFDAVAAIAGVRSVVEYEAQAAIELEAVAPPDSETTTLNSYPYSITTASTAKVVRLGELIEAVVNDARHGVAASAISGRFHMTVATIIIDMCQRLRRDAGINTVVLSGGVFQNRLLFRVAVAALEREGFHVLTHRLVPSNDGGLSLGQAVVAHFVASGRRSKACA
jgi:hydrogenase maturation protein HypF